MNNTASKLAKILCSNRYGKWSCAMKALIIGAVGGILAIFYRVVTDYGYELSLCLYRYIRQAPLLIILFLVSAVSAGLLIAWLIKLEPMAAGGGVPQVEGLILYGLKFKWYAVILIRYIAGIVGSVFGLSFGPEGPSVQLGAAIGNGVSNGMCHTKLERNCLITSGAAAGLSAAFGAPLAGLLFALEEIHRSFSPLILLSAASASLVSDFISKYFFGLGPIIRFDKLPLLPLNLYPWLIPIAIFAGLSGVASNKVFLLFQSLYGKIDPKFRPSIALITALPCGLFIPQVLGSGKNLINIAMNKNCTLTLLITVFAIKLIFSGISFGSGTPGGIFMPIISIGALAGNIAAYAAVQTKFPHQYLQVLIICAIAAGLTSCIKTPITSIVLTMELTNSLAYLLPAAICSFIALLISDILHTKPIYGALLNRLVKSKAECNKTGSIEWEIVEFPVEQGSFLSGRYLSEIEWPGNSLIVSIRRGTGEVIPRGGTKIFAGDYLLILIPENSAAKLKCEIKALCHNNIE